MPLVAPQGIFKPKILDLPLSITTTPDSPYADSFSADGYLEYKYRGSDPNHRDNVGLRQVYQKQLPLIYFHGIVPGKYLATWPVFIVNDHPEKLVFTAAVDDLSTYEITAELPKTSQVQEGRRKYLTATVKVRLHQRSFREKVLDAYRSQCAFCRLRHRELLDAAHIIPDHEAESDYSVENGMALCKLHHAAFDSFILGVSPDYIIRVREDILTEIDGPLLQYGLQLFEGRQLHLPQNQKCWPNKGALDWKYQQFLESK